MAIEFERVRPEEAEEFIDRVARESERQVAETGRGARRDLNLQVIRRAAADPQHRLWIVRRGDDEPARFAIWIRRGRYDGLTFVYIMDVWCPSRAVRAVLKWLARELAEREGLPNFRAAFPLGNPFGDLAQSVVNGRTDVIPGHSVIRIDTALARIEAAGW